MLNERPKPSVVSNTGPLISAFQCDKVDLFKLYFDSIYIVQSQLEEFKRHQAEEWIQELIGERFVKVITNLNAQERAKAEGIARRIAASPLTKKKEFTHHLPEAEAMVLMSRPELKCSVILLEELAARQVARNLGLSVTGFVAVLVRAAKENILTGDKFFSLLKMCQQKGTRYSNQFIEIVTRPYRR